MKRLMTGIWNYLCSVDWDNEQDIEACAVKHLIPTFGFSLLLVIGFVFNLGFEGWIAGTVLYMSGLVVLCLFLEESLEEKREEAREHAQEFNPPNLFGDAEFVKDERLKDNHFRKDT